MQENLFYAYANNKGADQPAQDACSLISTIIYLSLSDILGFKLAAVAVQTLVPIFPKTGFLDEPHVFSQKNQLLSQHLILPVRNHHQLFFNIILKILFC